jgi:hypothetical protein
MASRACRAEPRVLASNVTGGTRHSTMFAGKRKLGRVVIKSGRRPVDRRVAGLAGLRETRVARIFSGLILREVAGRTRSTQPRIFAADVA